MTKYILALIPFIFGFYSHSNAHRELSCSKPFLLRQIMMCKQVEQIVKQSPTQMAQQAKKQAETEKKAAPKIAAAQRATQAQPAKAAAPIATPAPAPKPAPTGPQLDLILVHLDNYVNCAFDCIKRFLDPRDKHKLVKFAYEIEQCVKELDRHVLMPLESIKTEPLARNIYALARALKDNQCEFRKTIQDGYTNSISLGMQLHKLKTRAVAHVHTELKTCTPCMNASSFRTQFAPIEKKIIALTNYGVNVAQAMKALQKRF